MTNSDDKHKKHLEYHRLAMSQTSYDWNRLLTAYNIAVKEHAKQIKVFSSPLYKMLRGR